MERKKFNPDDWLKQNTATATIRKTRDSNENTYTQIESLIQIVEELRLDITSIYTDWRNIGFAFAHEFGEAGRHLFHRISQFCSSYTPENCDQHFDKYLNSKGRGITIRTVFYLFKNAGLLPISDKGNASDLKTKENPKLMSSSVERASISNQNTPGGLPQEPRSNEKAVPKQLNDSNPAENESRADEILRISEHKYWLDFEEPTPCIEIVKDDKKTAFGTFGNISVTKGPPKSRKTGFVSLILAAGIKNGCIQNSIKCNLPEDKRQIVVFDTEQGEAHVNKVIKRAFALAGINSDELKSYSEIVYVHCLRPYAAAERVQAIERFVATHPGIGLVIIDGIRDLIIDTNSIEQSAEAVQHLMKWSFEKKLHVLTVIHVNKGDRNATGHLGGELTKKAETVVEVSRDKKFKNISLVKPTECRGMEFADLAFSTDEKGMPEIISYTSESETTPRRREVYPSDIEFEIHTKALKVVFEKESKLTSTVFHAAMIAAYGGLGIKFGESKARSFVEYVKQMGLVKVETKQTGNRTYFSIADSSEDWD